MFSAFSRKLHGYDSACTKIQVFRWKSAGLVTLLWQPLMVLQVEMHGMAILELQQST